LSTKATALFTIELTQLTDFAESNEQIVSISKFNFFDLPGVEILDENQETVENRQGPTLNKSCFGFTNIVSQLAANTGQLILYDTSMLGCLMREALGGNSYCLPVHTIQYGDVRGLSVALRLLTNLRRINSFPVINEGRSIGMMKKLLAEANQAYDNLQAMIGNSVEVMALKYAEMEKKLIEENLTRIRDADDKQKLSQKFIG
jgi:hypothetical protein